MEKGIIIIQYLKVEMRGRHDLFDFHMIFIIVFKVNPNSLSIVTEQ